jgi:FG-GAP repeat
MVGDSGSCRALLLILGLLCVYHTCLLRSVEGIDYAPASVLVTGAQSGDGLGRSVAVSRDGKYALFGAIGDDTNGRDAGSVSAHIRISNNGKCVYVCISFI